jgi:hypothetical protein
MGIPDNGLAAADAQGDGVADQPNGRLLKAARGGDLGRDRRSRNRQESHDQDQMRERVDLIERGFPTAMSYFDQRLSR